MLTLTRRFTFEACHHLPFYDGACHRLHGHSYKMEVTVTGDVITDTKNPKCGMIIDFKDLNKLVNDVIISKYDHQDLNQFFSNPTAEIMVAIISHSIMDNLPEGVDLVSVKLWETEDSYAEYSLDKL